MNLNMKVSFINVTLIAVDHLQGRNRNIFQRGQINFSRFFSRREMLFSVEISHFGTPKSNFSCLEK